MSQQLRLLPNDPKIADLCTRLEGRLTTAKELEGISLRVELLSDFDSLEEAKKSEAIRKSAAAYRVSTDTIYVNAALFEQQEDDVMDAIMAHEIGHACVSHRSLMKSRPIYGELGPFAEEFLADRLACIWGFFEGLAKMREPSYKAVYIAALSQWQNEVTYCEAMQRWRTGRLSGAY